MIPAIPAICGKGLQQIYLTRRLKEGKMALQILNEDPITPI